MASLRTHREHLWVLRLYLAYAYLELEQYLGSDYDVSRERKYPSTDKNTNWETAWQYPYGGAGFKLDGDSHCSYVSIVIA